MLMVFAFVFEVTKSGFPSPSKSATAMDVGFAPTAKSALAFIEAEENTSPPVNVGRNGSDETATPRVVESATVMGEYVAPDGTVTVSEVVVPLVTAAFAAPKKTMLFESVELKFDPRIVTCVPALPDVGEKEFTIGEPTTVNCTVTLIGVTFVVVLITRGVPAVVPVNSAVYVPS